MILAELKTRVKQLGKDLSRSLHLSLSVILVHLVPRLAFIGRQRCMLVHETSQSLGIFERNMDLRFKDLIL